MNRIALPILMAVFLVSCSGPPKIRPLIGQFPSQFAKTYPLVFPEGDRRFVHAIEADLYGGEKAFMMGVTHIDSEKNKIHSILMTIEGLVLFDAESDGEIRINRAVAPFDSENFAGGLMGDVRLMFFRPEGDQVESGLTEAGSWIRRFRNREETTDIVIHQDGSRTIRQYHRNRLRRSIHAGSDQGPGGAKFPETLTLNAYIRSGYSLHLKLVEAEPAPATR